MDDPFKLIIDVMRKEGSTYNPPSLLLAEVVMAEPLLIKTGDLQIDKDNLMVADYLLSEYVRKFQTSQVGAENWGTAQNIKFSNSLKSGDKLAIMPVNNNQLFIILCKVVSL